MLVTMVGLWMAMTGCLPGGATAPASPGGGEDDIGVDSGSGNPLPHETPGSESPINPQGKLVYRQVEWTEFQKAGTSTIRLDTLAIRQVSLSRVKETVLAGRPVAKFLVRVESLSPSDLPQQSPDVGYAFVEMTADSWLLWAYIGETADLFRKRGAYWIDSVQIESFPSGQPILQFPLAHGNAWISGNCEKEVIGQGVFEVPASRFTGYKLSCASNDLQQPTVWQWYSEEGLLRQIMTYPASDQDGGMTSLWKSLELVASTR